MTSAPKRVVCPLHGVGKVREVGPNAMLTSATQHECERQRQHRAGELRLADDHTHHAGIKHIGQCRQPAA